ALSLEGGADSDDEYQQLMERILAIQQNNLHALRHHALVAQRRKDRKALESTLARLERLAPQWSNDPGKDPRPELARVREALDKAPQEVEFRLTRFGNLLAAQLGYRRDSSALSAAEDARIGTSLQHFLKLAQPAPTPSPPDRDLKLTVEAWPPAKEAGLDK